MRNGWLVHDRLQHFKGGGKYLWPWLLEWVPGLQNKCAEDKCSHIEFLADYYFDLVNKCGEPDYIVRDATYWRPVKLKSGKILSVINCIRYELAYQNLQIEVCNSSNKVIAVSNFVKDYYKNKIENEIEVLPIGTDFNLFKPLNKEDSNKFNVLPNSILWVGDTTTFPKGFDILLTLIKETQYNFCVVLKRNVNIQMPGEYKKRVKFFTQLSHEDLTNVVKNCKLFLCTSRIETLHLASVEAGACNLPIVTTNVGLHKEQKSGKWGEVVDIEYVDTSLFYQCMGNNGKEQLNTFNEELNKSIVNFYLIPAIEKVFNNYDYYSPREYYYKKYSTDAVKDKWVDLIDKL